MSALLALQTANDTRKEIAALRKQVRAGKVSMVDVLEDPPSCLLNFTLLDVVRLGYAHSTRSSSGIERFGHMAVRDGINLCMPLSRASLRTRRWVATHARWSTARNGRPMVEDIA